MAIEDKYIQALRSPITIMIQCSIYDLFDFLKQSYGRLLPEQLKAKETLIDTFVYDPSTNVNTVFNVMQ